MNTNKFAFRAAATATRAAYATKDAVTTAASNTKRESKSLFAALKAGYAAARDEHARGGVSAEAAAAMDAAREKYEAHVQSTAHLHKY